MRLINKKNLITSVVLSLLGVAFLVYYIYRASTDVVASDYIRVINYYLEDVTDLHLLFSWEGISRIPFSFLARFINVKFFNYSVYFDKVLGTVGLFIFNTVTVYYVLNNLKTKLAKVLGALLTTYISFSLISWEMILNGTGFAHFITIGLIALTFYVVGANACGACRRGELCEPADTVGAKREIVGAKREIVGASYASPSIFTTIKIVLLIIITSLLFAGSYCVSYLCTLIFFAVVFLIMEFVRAKQSIVRQNACEACRRGELCEPADTVGVKHCEPTDTVRASYASPIANILIIIVSIVCLLMYFKSNNTGEALIPVGFKDISLVELLKTNPLFPLKFLLKSLASSIIGVETFDYALNFGTISEKMIFFIGLIYLIIILYAIIILIKMIIVACRGELCEPADIVGANHREPASVGANHREPASVGASYASPRKNTSHTFILMYLVYGIANYALVFLARYKFVVDSYGMSSRYGIQYMFLTIAVLFILLKNIDIFVASRIRNYDACDIEELKENCRGELCEPASAGANFRSPLGLKNIIALIISIASISFITIGHLTTNTDEIFKSDYRKIIYSILEDKAKNYKDLNDEDLENSFEFHRGPEQIRKALGTLEKQHLNIFRE